MAQKPANMIGQKIGKLTIIARDNNPPERRNSWWVCQCDCGNIKSYKRPDLIKQKGGIKSCGCSEHEPKLKYRKDNPAEYECWKGIRARCNNQNRPGFKNYGARGIKVCERWNSFDNFFEDMGPKPYPEATIERVNNNGDYEPSNCRWESRETQSRNRRYNVINSKSDADNIRTLYNTGNYTHKQLATMYNCDEPIIWQILNNYTWV